MLNKTTNIIPSNINKIKQTAEIILSFLFFLMIPKAKDAITIINKIK
jgi:hypothetical protein